MAVNFGAQTTEAPQVQSFDRPTKPVETDRSFLGGIADIFDQAGEALAAGRVARSEKQVAEFTRQQLLVADGVDQGQYGSAYARTLLRRNLISAIEANPGISKDLIKAQSSILGIAGGAQVVDEGTQAEQRREARFEALVNDGLLSPDASDDEFDQASEYFQQATEAKRRFDETTRTIDLELKQAQLSNTRRTQLEEQKKAEAQRYLTDLAPAQFQGMKTRLNDIVNGPGTESEKVQQIDDMFVNFNSELTATVGNLSSHESSALMAPFEELQRIYTDRATGKTTDEELTRGIERTLALQQKVALADPAVARIAVASKLFGSGALGQIAVQSPEGFNAALNYMSGNGQEGANENPFVADTTSKSGLKSYLNSVTEGINSTDETIKAEAQTHLNSVLESVEDYAGLLRRDPTAGIEIVEYFASPAFLKATQNSELSEEAMQGAEDVVARNYADEVWGLVRREFRENTVTLVPPGAMAGNEQEVAATEAIQAVSTPSGVNFVATEQPVLDPGIARQIRVLNRDLKPVINNTVRALAHLEGRSDYQAMWDEIGESILSGNAGPAGGDSSDDLDLSVFQQNPGLTEETAQLVNLLDATETGGTGSYDTLLGFSEKNKFSNVKVSEMTIDEVLEFQTGSEYRQFSKDQVGRVATPVGRFQIVGTTLKGLVKELGLTGNEPFDEEMQNRLFNTLLQRRLRQAGGDVNKAIVALRNEWEGFQHVPAATLQKAIEGLL